MRRLLIEAVKGSKAFLSDKELHHLTRVLRARQGTEFEGIDDQGCRHVCRLQMEAGEWYGEIISSMAEIGESPFRVSLAQALIKKDKFEWVIQKAVELGVAEVTPIVSERTEVRLSEAREERKMRRWQRILEAAVKQTGRSRIPRLNPPLLLKGLLDEQRAQICVAMDEEGGQGIRGLFENRKDPGSCLVLIGPEGGWGHRDRQLFSSHAVLSASLGPRTLRTETAAVVALSILQYEFGDLQGSDPRRSID